MTQNQIAYWNLQENARHNAMQEWETMRTNRANEAIKRETNRETQSYNTQKTAQGWVSTIIGGLKGLADSNKSMWDAGKSALPILSMLV